MAGSIPPARRTSYPHREEYASLQAAGTPATLRRFDGLVHGFANMVGVSQVCRAAVVEIASMLRHMLAEAPARRHLAK